MKCSQLIEYNKKNKYLQKLYRRRGRETNPRLLFAFLNALYEVKKVGFLQLGFNIFR